MKKIDNINVLHLPNSIGGNAIGLIEGEKLLGLNSQALSLSRTKFAYPTDLLIDLDNKNLLTQLIRRISAFLKFRTGYDVYHFNFGASLIHAPKYGLNLLDLPYYTKNAIKIMTFQGCDARQKYPTINRLSNSKTACSAACLRNDCYQGICNSGKRDLQRQKTIEKASHYVDHMFALNPDLMHFLPQEKASFLPYTIANFNELTCNKFNFFANGKIKIVHAPSQRAVKGTDRIQQVISELQHQFPGHIEFDLIENLPHQQALQRYAQADLFIDQIYIGWYGAAAVEAMKLGIPVAVYINQNDLKFIPSQMSAELPFFQINEYNLKEKLVSLIKDREILFELQKKVLLFVNKWHAPQNVASLTNKIYQHFR